jgi:hypothetical protein
MWIAIHSMRPPVPGSERYTKLLKDREFRLQRAEKIGTEFTLPKPSTGLRGLLIPFRKVG